MFSLTHKFTRCLGYESIQIFLVEVILRTSGLVHLFMLKATTGYHNTYIIACDATNVSTLANFAQEGKHGAEIYNDGAHSLGCQ